MRHFIAPSPIALGSSRVSNAPTARALIASSSLAHTVTAYVGGAIPAISIAAIAPAADEDLRPATGAQVQAARGRLHWRFLENAKDEESTEVDGPREQCDTDRSHGSPAGRRACHLDPMWRCGTVLDLAVEAGAAPVVLLRQTPFYHAHRPMRRGARLQSPYGLLTSRPASTSRFRQVGRVQNADFYICVMPPRRDAAGKARILTAIDSALCEADPAEYRGRQRHRINQSASLTRRPVELAVVEFRADTTCRQRPTTFKRRVDSIALIYIGIYLGPQGNALLGLTAADRKNARKSKAPRTPTSPKRFALKSVGAPGSNATPTLPK